jgi:nitroimidazol reductase NimA-like FMN-containing flavoprotein (pyridoxamine 5'-phosphate oxidase superfamily)
VPEFRKTKRTTLGRLPKRGSYDRDTIHRIIDEALICHVGFTEGDQPCVLPTALARIGDAVYIHGSRISRMLQHLASGAPACIVVTLVDGLVLARSGFHHSMNYRSVVIYGCGSVVTGPDKRMALDTFVERLVPGRVADIRPISRKELNATTVIRYGLDEVSAKIRQGPPVDDAEDYELPVWAGILPLRLEPGVPVADPDSRVDVRVPGYLKDYQR